MRRSCWTRQDDAPGVKKTFELFRDVVVLVRDTGMRNQRELYRVRIEKVSFETGLISIPASKTPGGVRDVPMTDRVAEILRRRVGTRTEGWLFPSKRSESGHLTRIAGLFRQARQKARLPRELVLYCGRHDFGIRVYNKTGNLKLVMKSMGHVA
jgi:integrase